MRPQLATCEGCDRRTKRRLTWHPSAEMHLCDQCTDDLAKPPTVTPRAALRAIIPAASTLDDDTETLALGMALDIAHRIGRDLDRIGRDLDRIALALDAE